MKTLAITLFISAFLVSSIYCDPCADAFAYADMSINRLRSNFVVEQYPNMFEDFEDIMKSAELIQETCAENVEFAIESHQFYTCSMAYVMLSELLDNYVFHHGDMISTLSQIVGLIPTIEGKICLDEWEVTAMQKQQDMGDEFWSDHDATDDYDYDKSDNYDDNFLVEDEEDEDTGDEIHSDSDEETGETAVWADDDDEDEKIEFSSDISTDYDDDDDENENEEEDDIDDVERDEDEETIVMIQEVANEEEPLMVFVDLSNEADAVEVEEEALLTHEIPAVTKEDEEMLKVFVKMTNMANMENEEFSFEVEEEETFSTYANISGENGEYALEIDNGDGSVFVYVDINTVLGADEVVNAIFADGQDDIEMEVSEMDLQQYWDDEEDGDDY